MRLAPATPGGIRFTVTVPEIRRVPVAGGAGAVRLEIDGYDPAGVAGDPALPERIVLVAVPALGDVRLNAAGSDAAVLEMVELAPIPTLERGQDAREERSGRNGAAYSARPSATPRARLLDVSWMRNQRVARIAIAPAEYDPVARRVVVSRRVDVDVAITPTGDLGAAAEPDDAFEAVYRASLVNYEQGRAWRRPATRALLEAARRRGEPLEALGVAVPDTSVYVNRDWVKISVPRTGFYRVLYGQLNNFNLFAGQPSAELDSLRLFAWSGANAPVLPEDSYCDACDYREVAIGVIDNNNGFFDKIDTDAIYFYALGPSDWANLYDPSKPDTTFINNPYDAHSFLYLTVARPASPVGGTPKRIGSPVSTTPTGLEAAPTTYDARVHNELDTEYWPDVAPIAGNLFWEKWFWRSFKQAESFTTTVDLPGADTTQTARLRMRVWGLNTNIPTPPAFKSIPDHFLNVSFNPALPSGIVFPRRTYDGATGLTRAGQTWDTTGTFLRTIGNTLVLNVPLVIDPNNPQQRVDRSGLAWYDLFFKRHFVPIDDAIDFVADPAPNGNLFTIGPFVRSPNPPRVFDVTDPFTPIEIGGLTYAPISGGYQLQFAAAAASRRLFRVVPDSIVTRTTVPSTDVFDAVVTARLSQLGNLRSHTKAADYLVIYYDGFQAAADSLARWRIDRLPLINRPVPYQTLAIPISALYDQFSGGRTDPSAIRSFLRAAFYNWQRRPVFVTLLGDASYDFKNITGRAGAGQPGTLLPSYESGIDRSLSRQFSTDDWMLNVDNATDVFFIPDFFGGRIPAPDASTALEIIRNKVLLYERTAPLGEYRNRIMLIADDNHQGDNCDDLAWEHVKQTTTLDTLDTPAHFDRSYVYLHTYADGPGATKPGAHSDIIRTLNEGVLMANYVGHGSPFKMSDEGVFLDSDAGTLTNAAKLAVFIAASCDVGKFNDPTVQSLGERLLSTPGGGCVGVISATEQAFSNQNAQLNRLLYDEFFDRNVLIVGTDTLASIGQYHVPLSASLLAAKGGGTNSQKYQLMGDAATVLNAPRLWVELTLETEAGAPVTTLQRGQTLVFRGRVLDRPGGTDVPYAGVAQMLIEDSATDDEPACDSQCEFCPRGYDAGYRYKAGPVFRGDVSVTNGAFTGRFVVPLDAVGGPLGRLRAYLNGRAVAEQFDSDGVGSLVSQVIAGAASGTDTDAPRVTLSFVGGATSVRPDATLRIDLFDTSGIMITSHEAQNGIVVTLDDNTTSRVDVTSSFRYAADSYQSGTASFQLPNLAPGPHRIRVCAADNLALGITAAAHRACSSLDFEVVGVPPLNVARAYLFPNPTHSSGGGAGGQFVIDAPGDSLNAMLRIYTVTGRLIRTLKVLGGLGQIQMPWDGRDAEGDALANGTYLFKVYVNIREPDGSSSARQRAISEGRFVVLNR